MPKNMRIIKVNKNPSSNHSIPGEKLVFVIKLCFYEIFCGIFLLMCETKHSKFFTNTKLTISMIKFTPKLIEIEFFGHNSAIFHYCVKVFP